MSTPDPQLWPQKSLLDLSGAPAEATLDALKNWLAGDSAEVDLANPSTTDLIMALRAACDHISLDLDIHAHSLLERALSEEYGPMDISQGMNAFSRKGTFAWDSITVEAIDGSKRNEIFNMLPIARAEIAWLRKQIRRLEYVMAKVKEGREVRGYMVPRSFEVEARPEEAKPRMVSRGGPGH